MRRRTILIGLVILPTVALALDFTDTTNRFSDAPFAINEAAGIRVLTNLGAINGNPDGTFAPDRSVNRAEFLKIVFRSNAKVAATDSDADACFPDVKVTDWFSSYVCLAKKRGTVGGYPDGLFRPANPVNYAEALKILDGLYDLPLSAIPDNPWYARFVNAAAGKKLLLPSAPPYDAPLTRGQVAELVATFVSFQEGLLPTYRTLERTGTLLLPEQVSSSSSGFSRPNISSRSSLAPQSSLASDVGSRPSGTGSSTPQSSVMSGVGSSSSYSGFPAISRFLMVGMVSLPIADGTFVSQGEEGVLRTVDVILRRQVFSLGALLLVDSRGVALATLVPGTDNNADRTKWHADVPQNANTYRIARDTPTVLGIVAQLKKRGDGGAANELFETQDFQIQVIGSVSNMNHQILPVPDHRPTHQTADARILAVKTVMPATGTIRTGANKLIATFAITGETMTGGQLALDSLEFIAQKTNATITNVRIGGVNPADQADCALDTVDVRHVSCSSIPPSLRTLSSTPQLFSLYADVSLKGAGVTSGDLQVTFEGPGQIGQNGAIHWSDSTGHYNWIEPNVTLQNGPTWKVTQ